MVVDIVPPACLADQHGDAASDPRGQLKEGKGHTRRVAALRMVWSRRSHPKGSVASKAEVEVA